MGSIYEVPLIFHQEKLDQIIVDYLKMWTRKPDISVWEDIAHRYVKSET